MVPVVDRVQQLADGAGCAAPEVESPFADIEVRTWSDCDDGSEYVLTTVVGGGHTWPGSTLLGDAADVDPAALPEGQAELLDFFDAQR